jgi:hypothetical protein
MLVRNSALLRDFSTYVTSSSVASTGQRGFSMHNSSRSRKAGVPTPTVPSRTPVFQTRAVSPTNGLFSGLIVTNPGLLEAG